MKNLLVALALLLSLTRAGAAETCPPEIAPPDAEQAAALAAAAPDRGLLWRITRDGHSSYLYGSIHIGRPEWAYPGPALRAALAAADTLALELDLSDAATRHTLAQPPRPALHLGPALQARLDAQIRAACLPPGALGRQHALMQAGLLSLLAARWDGLDAAYGQEIMLLAWAQAKGRPVAALERAQDQLAALIPADAGEARRELQQALDELEAGAGRATLRRLAEAWARGDLATLADYERWCDCVHGDADRRMLRRLNDGRNPQLAQGIAKLHGEGRRVLAAVGALHMSGPQALPLLLGKMGFQVERLLPP